MVRALVLQRHRERLADSVVVLEDEQAHTHHGSLSAQEARKGWQCTVAEVVTQTRKGPVPAFDIVVGMLLDMSHQPHHQHGDRHDRLLATGDPSRS